MKNFKVFTAVCAAAVIALMSTSYSMAADNSSTMSKDRVMAMDNGTHHGNGSGTHNGTGGNHNGTGTGTCRK
ncbi:MAG: hypothetical protein HQK67_12360 [Desulfamplus sp.]|nr:hypothetical protein [Desulfamplus sp.]